MIVRADRRLGAPSANRVYDPPMTELPPFPAQPGWYIACRSKQLAGRPLARTVLGAPLVLFRDAHGRAATLIDRCPHRNAPLSAGRVDGSHLACPYHGWRFDGRGICRAVPGLCGPAEHAARDAAAYPTCEQDGFVWVRAGAGVADVVRAGTDDLARDLPPRFACLDAKGFGHFVGEATVDARLADAAENFLDATHTHFVHAGLIRTEGHRKEVTAIVRRIADGVEAEYPDEGRQSGLIARLFGADVDRVFGRFVLPSTVQLEYQARDRVKMLITLCFTPESEHRQRLYAVVCGRAPAMLRGVAALVIMPLFWRALRQDQRILALQSANIRRFGGPRYVYTELDVLGGHIARLLAHGPSAAGEAAAEKRVRMRV